MRQRTLTVLGSVSVLCSAVLFLCSAGCDRPAVNDAPRQRTVRKVVIVKRKREPGRSDAGKDASGTGARTESPVDWGDRPDSTRPAPPTNVPWRRGGSGEFNGGMTDGGSFTPPEDAPETESVMQSVFREIDESASSAPTVVVWLVDASPSARRWHAGILGRIRGYYEQRGKESKSKDSGAIETSIAVFGETVQWVLEDPEASAAAVAGAWSRLPTLEGAVERPFDAVSAAVERHLEQRTRQRKELLIVVITDEAGDDDVSLQEVISTPRKYGIPIHVIGVPAPFGRRTLVRQSVEGGPDEVPSPKDPVAVRQGPETWAVERIELEFPDEVIVPEAIDSGFGPYGLEWLARQTGGRFHAIFDDPSGAGWPSADMMRFPRAAMRGYRPRYQTRESYDRAVSQNKAVQALMQAARLPRVAVLTDPTLSFEKGDQPKMKVALDRAQRSAAKVELEIHTMYDLLWSGVAGRKTLSDPRWCASYDLAMGRIAAARARVDGYNAMLAALKRGVPSTDKEATMWVLEPAESTDVSSSLKGLVKRAREFLTRVKTEHPDTPWAYLAEQELSVPLGWKWTER